MRETLLALGCPADTHDYLFDGVYCGIDTRGQIWLVTERPGEDISRIALDATSLAALVRYARTYDKRIGR